MKKRILALAGAVVLTLSMTMTAFATPSTEAGGGNVTTPDGEPVANIKVVDSVSDKYNSALAGLDFDKVIAGTDYEDGNWVEAGDAEVVVEGEGEAKFPVVVSFDKDDFAGEPLILAYIDGAWKVLEVVDGGDVWKVTVPCETVLKFYEQKAASSEGGKDETPKTGDTTSFVWFAVALAAAATAVVATKRKMA